MFAVMYRFKLKPHQEALYIKCWNTVVNYFVEKCGAYGSILHKSQDGYSWVAYSRWPDKQTRDASWPPRNVITSDLPAAIQEAMQMMQSFKEENKDLEDSYEEICLEVISDKLSHC